jgi:hypothetical protein
MTLEGLGRVLHGAQDFYAHSNWADTADPTRPVGVDNPPGLKALPDLECERSAVE